MKVSIWQQFSSNNSTHYVIVGEFRKASDAKEARLFLINMLREIMAYHQSRGTHPTHDPSIYNELTPVEQFYQQRYGWEWKEGINWIGFNERQIEEYVEQVDGLLVLRTMNDSLMNSPTKAIEHVIEHFQGLPHVVLSWGKQYKAIVDVEMQSEQDAGNLYRTVKDNRLQFTDNKDDYVFTTVQRKRKYLTFTLSNFWNFVGFIKYLKTYKPKHLSYTFKPINKSS